MNDPRELFLHELGDILYDTPCGSFLPIITRYRTEKKKEVLILAICVEPCAGK